MGYKPDVVQKTKFECSPLGHVFHKRLEKDEKQVGLLKILKNIEDKTEKQLNENKDIQLGIKSVGYDIKKDLSREGLDALKKIGDKGKKLTTDTLG